MPNSGKKQKLSKEEKARRKLRSHSTSECAPEWKKYDYSRTSDAIINRTNKSNFSNIMLDSVLKRGEMNFRTEIHKTVNNK
tara:strand:+ start:1367 stop:1609 length:243 start_codon:yes stop_codon:yes gene_type:complete